MKKADLERTLLELSQLLLDICDEANKVIEGSSTPAALSDLVTLQAQTEVAIRLFLNIYVKDDPELVTLLERRYFELDLLKMLQERQVNLIGNCIGN